MFDGFKWPQSTVRVGSSAFSQQFPPIVKTASASSSRTISSHNYNDEGLNAPKSCKASQNWDFRSDDDNGWVIHGNSSGPVPAPASSTISTEPGVLGTLGPDNEHTGHATQGRADNRNSPYRSQRRRPGNRDEFDGPVQFLPKPSPYTLEAADHELPPLAISLSATVQDAIIGHVNACLAECAFKFVARYEFPIPLEPDKRRVSQPADREWTEWAHLLKRLATKRLVPARVLYGG